MPDQLSKPPDLDTTFYVLVTGANSGVGLAICCRLIDEFLQARPQSHTLHLIFTTRSPSKAASALSALKAHLAKFAKRKDAAVAGIGPLLEQRVHFHSESVDLTKLRSVAALARRLQEGEDKIPRLDVAIFNAGFAFWEIDWPRAIWTVLTDIPHAVTWPTFHKSYNVGAVTKQQFPPSAKATNAANGSANGSIDKSSASDNAQSEPPLGEIFTANLFGHYFLAHLLSPLLSAHPPNSPTRGRVIYLSSLEAYAHTFSTSDIQGLHAEQAYESSKRLTDILALTSTLHSTAPFVERFWSIPSASKSQTTQPKTYVCHPGICATSIMALPLPLWLAMVAAFYIARWVGSIWHTVSPYTGAISAVWLALSPQTTLDELEARGGPGKWGSATDWWGEGRVRRTEVEGWGFGGKVGEEKAYSKGRWRGAVDLTREKREGFEELGRECWREMEELREEWVGRLRRWEKEHGDVA